MIFPENIFESIFGDAHKHDAAHTKQDVRPQTGFLGA